MAAQDGASFGAALGRALREAKVTSKLLAEKLSIDASSVSRWKTDKILPSVESVKRIEEILNADLMSAFTAKAPSYELFIASPVTGITPNAISQHHDQVASVVASVRRHVDSVYWGGESVLHARDLIAPDIATEHNMQILARCSAVLYVQFEELIGPSGALIELGIALGKRLKTTIMIKDGLRQPFMLNDFMNVAAEIGWLPRARVYYPKTVEEACSRIEINGRGLLGLS